MTDAERAEHLSADGRHWAHGWRCHDKGPQNVGALRFACTRPEGHDGNHQAGTYGRLIVREWPGEQDALPIPTIPAGTTDHEQQETT